MSVKNLSLSQFMNFSTKKSPSARLKAVKDAKYGDDYHPGRDYWKKLRDEIKRIHEKDLPIEDLKNILFDVPKDREANYRKNINSYISFVKKNNVTYFPVGKAIWTFDETISVNANPELGLIINGVPHLVKNHYKKSDGSVSKQTIKTTLTAMQIATSEFVVPENAVYSVLNLQNKQLYSSQGIIDDDLMLLQSEAIQLSYMWNNV
ncbi:hypothetical protein CKN96_05910 [Carnobacterium maltaromaticum]|uniref:hypothetical protein n=1 Tax=Carnobacterium maltaromaticum TaxID=2751 RepID=UPI00026C8628|nr:hypothetical protein [Carnobacterium maltaromaticum]TFJ58896.1 hypothetical protein CKN96_05910 [Carnobacterium maltaromaticum]